MSEDPTYSHSSEEHTKDLTLTDDVFQESVTSDPIDFELFGVNKIQAGIYNSFDS